MIRSFPDVTARRIAALETYIAAALLADGRFMCEREQECRASRPAGSFYTGQMSHVGRNYDLAFNGTPLRIVVVGQEYGTGDQLVGVTERGLMLNRSSEDYFRGRGLLTNGNRRNETDRQAKPRNPHMCGTTSTLRLLLGRPVGRDAEGEQLLDGHLFDGFALVNFLLCSMLEKARGEYDGGAARGVSTQTMRRNCAKHFLKTMEILEPTVIVAQGTGVANWMQRFAGLQRKYEKRGMLQVGKKTVDVLCFHHPAAHGDRGYGSIVSKYLTQVVEPTIATYVMERYPFAAAAN